MDFAAALRERRTIRRLSQLDLANRAGTTQRHVSFMESGRSTPGRAMVVRLAESLELPLRERNGLLLAAGFAPAYAESALDGPQLAPVRAALRTILDGHQPYPALVVDHHGDVVATNSAFGVLTAGVSAALLDHRPNAYRIALHPDGLAPRIRNLAEWARHVLERLDQAIARGADEQLRRLRAELGSYVPEPVVGSGHLGFAVPVRLASEYGELHLMTTVTTFATAVDVTLSELKLEAFLPVDAATAAALARASAVDTALSQASARDTSARNCIDR